MISAQQLSLFQGRRRLVPLNGCPRCHGAVLTGSCINCGWQAPEVGDSCPLDYQEAGKRAYNLPRRRRGPHRMVRPVIDAANSIEFHPRATSKNDDPAVRTRGTGAPLPPRHQDAPVLHARAATSGPGIGARALTLAGERGSALPRKVHRGVSEAALSVGPGAASQF